MIKRSYYLCGEVTDDDIQFLHRAKVEFYPGEQEYLDFVEIGTNKHCKLPGKKHPVTVITTSDQEDAWLKLYFGDRLILEDKYFYDMRFYN